MTKLDTAIALGLGRGVKEIYFIAEYPMFHFDSEGKLLIPKTDQEHENPKLIAGYHHSEIVPFQTGKTIWMPDPKTDEGLVRAMVDREEFARPDPELQKKIDKWIESGLESHDLIAKVKAEGGLITLKDFGLKPLEEPEVTPPTGG